jgi:hypothetical protein
LTYSVIPTAQGIARRGLPDSVSTRENISIEGPLSRDCGEACALLASRSTSSLNWNGDLGSAHFAEIEVMLDCRANGLETAFTHCGQHDVVRHGQQSDVADELDRELGLGGLDYRRSNPVVEVTGDLDWDSHIIDIERKSGAERSTANAILLSHASTQLLDRPPDGTTQLVVTCRRVGNDDVLRRHHDELWLCQLAPSCQQGVDRRELSSMIGKELLDLLATFAEYSVCSALGVEDALDLLQREACRLELFDLHSSHELRLAIGPVSGARVDPVGNEQAEFVVVARRSSRDAQPLSELTDAQ